jgi:hypothetical protein
MNDFIDANKMFILEFLNNKAIKVLKKTTLHM